jgi:hypothetical protein
MKDEMKLRFWGALFSATQLWFTLGISVPCTIYLRNAREFSIQLFDLLLVTIPLLLLMIALSALLIRFLGPLKRPRFIALLFALATLVWFQGNILVWDYGPLDGRSIEWAHFRLNGVIDSTIWLAVLGLAVCKPLRFFRSAWIVAPAIIVIQVLSLFLTTATQKHDDFLDTIKAYSIEQTQKFSFSTDPNAILIVLDETQSNIFADVIKSDSSYRDMFDGFTYFPNAVAGSNYTELAIPALLTGRLYDNRIPKDQYLKEAFLHDSVFAVLKRNQYRVDIFPWMGWANEAVYFDRTIADNLTQVDRSSWKEGQYLTEKKIKEVVHLADLALFRSAPHFLKPHIYNDQRWFLIQIISNYVPDKYKQFVSDDPFESIVFANQADREMRAELHGNVFKYYHLKGNHGPLTATEDMQVTKSPVPYTQNNYVLQLKVSLKALRIFFAALKRLKIYDQTLIVIVGDHGSGMAEGLYLNSTAGARAKVTSGIFHHRGNFRKDKARGVPLVLVKRIGAKGPMQEIWESPVSLLDIPATIAAEMGLDSGTSGISMFHAYSQLGRVRRYAAIEMTPFKADYVGDITVYDVDGNSWQDESWAISEILSPPPLGKQSSH